MLFSCQVALSWNRTRDSTIIRWNSATELTGVIHLHFLSYRNRLFLSSAPSWIWTRDFHFIRVAPWPTELTGVLHLHFLPYRNRLFLSSALSWIWTMDFHFIIEVRTPHPLWVGDESPFLLILNVVPNDWFICISNSAIKSGWWPQPCSPKLSLLQIVEFGE